MPLTGGCQCGAVRYEIAVEPLSIYVCHCQECQKQSASAFGISVIVPADAFKITQGAAKQWSRKTDTGRTLLCMFCPDCGSRIWHANPTPEVVSVKGGSLDAPPDLCSAIHIWTARKLAGVVIPEGALQFPGEPT